MADIIVGLYDTETDTLLSALEGGETVSSSSLTSATTLLVQIDPTGTLVGLDRSVRLTLINGTVTYTGFDNNVPYTLFGDRGADLLDGVALAPGDYQFTVEVFSRPAAKGTLLGTYDISFAVAANAAPVAAADTATVLENGFVVIDVLANDTDAEDGAPDPATVEIADADDASGQVRTVAGEGAWSVDAVTGAITFAPEADYAGAVTPIAYTVADSAGLRSAPAQVSVTITAANAAPVADPIDAGAVAEDAAPVLIDLLADASASDSDGGTLAVTNVVVQDGGGASVAVDIAGSVLAINPAQFASALPAGESTTLSITYDVTDGQGGVTSNTGLLLVEGLDGPFTWYVDADADGFGVDDPETNQTTYMAPPGTSAVAGDADDADRTVYPGALEVKDGKDNDQDGEVDEGNPQLVPATDAARVDQSEKVPETNILSVTPSETASPTVSLFDPVQPAFGALYSDGTALELGMRFVADTAGGVAELKYWRAAGDATDTDVREGRIWDEGGNLLATLTFTSAPGETGWQTAAFETPVQISANSVYTISYRTNDNYFAANDFFTADYIDLTGQLTAPTGQNGVYLYGSTVAFPDQSFRDSNYWVDLSFVGPNAAAGGGGRHGDGARERLRGDRRLGQRHRRGGRGARPGDGGDRRRRRRQRPGEDGGGRGRLERRCRHRRDHLCAGGGLRRRGDADRLHRRRQRRAALGAGPGQRDDHRGERPAGGGGRHGDGARERLRGDRRLGQRHRRGGRGARPGDGGDRRRRRRQGQVRTVAGEGAWSVDAVTGAITFAPEADYAGAVTPIAYTVADSAGLRSAPAQVSVTITAANDAPVAAADTATVLENGCVVIDVLANDTDAEDGAPDPATVEIADADDARAR